jgi:hypothetical protein
MRRNFAIGTLFAALTCAGSVQLSAQDNGPGNQVVLLIPDGETVYDVVNHVTWLADANLAAQGVPGTLNFRFGLPLCNADSTDDCIWADGAMSYTSAREWVRRMNAASYLGHSNWRLPSTPFNDSGCTSKGPSHERFGFGCSAGALGFLYYMALGIEAPNTAVPIPPNTVGPFQNFQPGVYWSNSYGGGLTDSKAVFSFADGAQGGTNTFNYSYALPMINGEIPGTGTVSGKGLVLSLNGLTVYDPVAHITWPVDANLAAREPFSLKPCESPTKPTLCVAADGSMNYASAEQFVADMNTANYGAENNKEQLTWELPRSDPACPQYNCTKRNPMGELYYTRLGLQAGTPVVPIPDDALGPFHHLQPGYYWSCEAPTIDHPCVEDSTPVPNTDAQFDFSFGNGFLSTARETGAHFVTVYYVGCDPDQSWCQAITFPTITSTEDALSSLTLSATASSGLAVSFTSMTTKVCTVSGNTASLLFPGICTIEASQAGNDSFESALPVQQTFTVNHAVQTITFPGIPAQKVGAEVHLRATASSGLKVWFSAGSSQGVSLSTIVPVCIVAGESADMLKVGNCVITAHQAGNDVYAPAPDVVRSVGVGP